ncbi:MAG: hypothetical protein KDD46_07750 [Bdellovibrionales bacterium]|nr:hypothetical protein [Bdellovibrionales bacterium]
MTVHLPAHFQPFSPVVANQQIHPTLHLLDQYIELFSARLKQNSESVEDYIELGNLFRQKGKYRKAFQLHRNLLAREKLTKEQKCKIFSELGYDYLYSKTKDCGQTYFENALDLDKKNTYALEGLYQSLRLQGKHEKAIDALTKLIKLEPHKKRELGIIYNELALIAAHDRDLSLAKKWHKKAAEYGENPFYHLTKIQIYMMEKEHEQAIQALSNMIVKYPKYAHFPIQKLQDLLFEIGQYSRYFQILHSCEQRSSNNPFVMHALAKYYEKTHQNDKAKIYYHKAMDLYPEHIQIFKDGCTFLEKQKDATTLASIQQFLQSLTQNRKLICHSCENEFDYVPSDCTICHGWNLFDIEYTLRS